jgi:excisionase family DNA binding protein
MTTWLTVDDVCAEIGVSRSTFEKWRAKGVAPAARKLPNRSLRIARADFDEWLERLPEVA